MLLTDFCMRRFLPLFVLGFIFLQACKGKESNVTINPEEIADPKDSVGARGKSTVPDRLPDHAFNTFKRAKDETEKEARQRAIIMQIDSTYATIHLLEEIKKELNEDTPEELTREERNKRSKIIFRINIIQNELTRTIDASILANLQTKTDELAGITQGLEKDINHLQHVTAKLNKATQSIAKLTNMLAYGLSQGWIKPLTPKGASVTAVKAGVN
jgi:hypothetical protein